MTAPVRRGGFTLVEVLVALTLLAVGLLGVVGTLLTARRTLGAAERLHLATQAAASVADSLLGAGAPSDGSTEEPWGRLRWSASAGAIEVFAEDPSGGRILEWWIPRGGR